MSPLKSNRLAWSVAVASLALWVTSAPITWGQVASGASSRILQTADDGSNTTTISQDIQEGDTTIATNDGSAQSAACPTPPPAIANLVPTPMTSSAAVGQQPGTFHICGSDPAIATAIEQLIGGRGFSASLASHGDGCADLTIRPSGQVGGNGSASSNLSVSLGSGRNLSIQIVSEQGATRASITVG